MSFSSGEFAAINGYDATFNHPGITFTASSGDGGFAAGTQYPASSAFVIAVGGTSLTLDGNGKRVSETAWSGAGSGCSAFIPKPTWQTDAGCPRRTVADIAAVAGGSAVAMQLVSSRWQMDRIWLIEPALHVVSSGGRSE